MDADRIDHALQRIEAALARVEAAHGARAGADAGGAAASARVIELVNAHEKLREQVSETLRDLDDLIGKMEG